MPAWVRMTDPQPARTRKMADLLVELAKDLESEEGEASAIRASVAHGIAALGATSASIFLLGEDGRTLHGALSGWDWTRTSFDVPLAEWPNVRRSVEADEVAHFTAADAEGSEQGWFERRGIHATTCTPMTAGGRVLGVVFFDYSANARPELDLELAKRVADQCARLVLRAEARVTFGGSPSSAPSAPDR